MNRVLVSLAMVLVMAGGVFAQAVPQAGGGLADELSKDATAQKEIDEVDKERERTQQIVNEVRRNAQRFRLARARLQDVLNNRDCVVTQRVLADLDRQEADVRKLIASLDKDCAAADPKYQRSLADTCATERRNLQQEIDGLAKDRVIAKQYCPGVTQ